MVQTPVGANSNPWIAYMRDCRAKYHEMNSLEPKKPTAVKTTVVRKTVLKSGPRAKAAEGHQKVRKGATHEAAKEPEHETKGDTIAKTLTHYADKLHLSADAGVPSVGSVMPAIRI